MEEHLAVGLFDQRIHGDAVGVVPSGGGGIELAPNGALVAGKIADTAVLGAERVSKERDGHGVRRR